MARFGAVGACVQTTLLHTYLTKIVPHLKFSSATIPKDTLRRYATLYLRLGVHLFGLMPFRIGIIFFALSTLKHLSFSKGMEGLQANYLDGLKAAYCYWPFVFIPLYTIVPRRYGNLYYDSFNLLWAVALSYYASRDHHSTCESEGKSSGNDS